MANLDKIPILKVNPAGFSGVSSGVGQGLGQGSVAAGASAARKPPGLRVRFSRINGQTPRGVLERPLWLPVVMGDFVVAEEAAHADYETIGAGQFSAPAGGPASARQLREADMQSLTLDWDAPWTIGTRTPAQVKVELYKILRSRRPFLVLATITGSGTELRMNATLRSINRTLRPGEADTRYYDLQVREWREASVVRKSSAGIGRKGGAGGQTKLPAKHKLTAGDTFNSLSRDYYGSYTQARDIAQSNGVYGWGMTTPIVQTDRFKVGDSITIPEKQLNIGTLNVGRILSGG
jgi:nucleoid-associated protein YgaU